LIKEVVTVWNEPTQERLAKIPRLYETENTPLKEKLIYLDFFIAGCDWYIAEYDGEDLFWGFALLNDDYEMAEWGYVSFSELKELKVDGWLEVDCELEESWKIRKASEMDRISIAQGWLKEEKTTSGISKKHELILKVKAGHFQYFQDLFTEVTSPYSEYFGIDPYPIWEVAYGHRKT
jgi:hypothetical protein